jgi:hypothetical protein
MLYRSKKEKVTMRHHPKIPGLITLAAALLVVALGLVALIHLASSVQASSTASAAGTHRAYTVVSCSDPAFVALAGNRGYVAEPAWPAGTTFTCATVQIVHTP